MSKPRLGIIGDWGYANSGFGNVVKNALYPLKKYFDIHHLAINYGGDYHASQSEYKFYHVGDHVYGFNKIGYFLKAAKPDILIIVQDPFIADKLITKVKSFAPDLPCILYTPVDSPNVPRKYVNPLNQFDHIVAYTEFGRKELQRSGLTKPCTIIPHGVDTSVFYPVDRQEAREKLDFPEDMQNAFVVGYVAMNQPRKKIDVWIYTINEWLKRYPHDDVMFYYHGPIVRNGGLDIPQYIEYLDSLNAEANVEHILADRFITTSDDPLLQVDETMLRYIYNAFDVYFHACASGGWELPVHEAMSCSIPVIAPDYSAVGEWANGGIFYVPVDDTPDAVTSMANTVHRTLNIHWAIEALENLYRSKSLRDELGRRGYEIAIQDKFNWRNISNQFLELTTKLLSGKEAETK